MAFDASTARPLNGFDPNTAKPDAAPAATNSDVQDGTDEGALFAALHGAADTATFGLSDRAAALLGAGINDALGHPTSYHDAYARIKANVGKTAGNHPLAAAAGDVGGIVAGGGALSAGAKALESVPLVGDAARAAGKALALKSGEPVLNTAKAAATGAGFGAADAAGHGGNEDQILTSAGLGAVAGPVVGKVATSVVKALSPAADKAMRLLADKIGESPDVLQRAYRSFQQATGRVPTLAEIVGLKSSGELRQLAAGNSIVGTAATEAADRAAAARPTTLPQQIEATTGQPAQDISTLTQARKSRMDAAMKPIRGTRATIDTNDLSTLTDPRVRDAIRGDPDLRREVGHTIQEIEDSGSSDNLTVGELDAIRKGLRGRQAAYSNPANNLHNPHTAMGYGDVADRIAGLATGAEPGYQDALGQFEADSHYIRGFSHGLAGKDMGEASTPDLINSLQEPEGRQGYASGVQTRLAQQARGSEAGATRVANDLSQNAGTQDQVREALGPQAAAKLRATGEAEATGAERLNTIAPGAPNPGEQPSGRQAVQAGAAAMSHSPAGLMFHLARAVPSFSKLSPAVQGKIAEYLLNPRMTQQGINLLRKAGADNAAIRRLALAISANTGANSGEALAGQ